MGNKKPFIYEGKRYESLASFLRINGIANKDYRDIQTTLNFQYVPLFSNADGDFYTLKSVADFYGIKIATLRDGYFRAGLPIEEIIRRHKKGLKMTGKMIVDHLGNEFSTMSEMAEAHGINLRIYTKRIKLGYTIEQALTTQKYQRIRPNRTYRGKEIIK